MKKYGALSICALFGGIWWYLLNFKYYRLAYSDWDLAFFTQACWQLLHGSQYVPLVGINYFGDHSYFFTFLILPFFALIPHPLTLIALKILAYVISAYLFYRICVPKLGEPGALVFMVLYLIFPANVFSMLYEFNPECFATPILFWMFMAWEKQDKKQFLLAALLLVLIKENMLLIVGAFGIYGLLNPKGPKIFSLMLILLSAVLFYVLSIHVIPSFRHLQQHSFVVRYAYLGNSLSEIIANIFIHPDKVFKFLFSEVNLKYINNLFGAMLIPAFLSGHLLLFILPILLQHLLSMNYWEHTIYHHYGMTMAPFIFLAAMRTFGWFETVRKPLLYVLVLMSVFILWGHRDELSARLDYHHDRLSDARWSFVSAIPDGAGVIATFDYLPPLALRHDLYSFQKIYDDRYQDPQKMKSSELNVGKPFALPESVTYAVIDWQDGVLDDMRNSNPDATSARVKAFLENGGWKTIKKSHTFELLKREPGLHP